MRYLLLALVILLSGCASTGVVPKGGGVYMIDKTSAQACCGPPNAVKAEVFAEASEFCARTNQDIEVVNLAVTNTIIMRPGNVSLEFRCK